MENTNMPARDHHVINTSSLFKKTGNAYQLIKEGKDKEARTEFPMEYHFIMKYLPSSVDELAMYLTSKLQVF